MLKGYKGDLKPTLTHFGIKAMAQILHVSRWNVNGKFLFGKFVPFPTVDVTCLVDIEGGKDLAALTVDNCDELNVLQIAEFIGKKAKTVKTDQGGGQEHKKRTGSATFFPPFILSVLLQATKFIAYYLGLSVP